MDNQNKSNIHDLLHKDIKDIFMDASKAMLDGILNKERLSLNEFIKNYSLNIDKYIIETQNSENIKFIAGNLSINTLNNTVILMVIDLYFKNASGGWINKKTKLPDMEMDAYLNDDAIQYLLNQKSVTFDINPPS